MVRILHKVGKPWFPPRYLDVKVKMKLSLYMWWCHKGKCRYSFILSSCQHIIYSVHSTCCIFLPLHIANFEQICNDRIMVKNATHNTAHSVNVLLLTSFVLLTGTSFNLEVHHKWQPRHGSVLKYGICQSAPGFEDFKCDACGKKYRWKTSLVRHQREECGRDPQFQCPFCPSRTKLKCNLKKHIRHFHEQVFYQT